MKSLVHLVLAMTASFACAEQLGLVRGSTRQLHGARGATGSARGRQLKGKGSGKGSSKGSKSGDCDSQRVYYLTKDLRKHAKEIEGAGGGRNSNSTIAQTVDELPIYYAGHTKKAGFLTEASIITGDDCSYTGVFSFDPNAQDRSTSQIFYQGSCSSARANAVTGGTGDFICASGIVKIAKRTSAKVFLDIEVCNTC